MGTRQFIGLMSATLNYKFVMQRTSLFIDIDIIKNANKKYKISKMLTQKCLSPVSMNLRNTQTCVQQHCRIRSVFTLLVFTWILFPNDLRSPPNLTSKITK